MANPYVPPVSGEPNVEETRLRQTAQVSWVAIFGPLFIQMLLACACGHLHLYTLPVTLGILCFAIAAYLKPTSRTLVGLIGVAIAVLFFAKHMADILWHGHDPLIKFLI